MSGELGRALGVKSDSVIKIYKDLIVEIYNAGSDGYRPRPSMDDKILSQNNRVGKMIDAGILYIKRDEGIRQARFVVWGGYSYKLTEVGEDLAKKLLAEKETRDEKNKNDFLPFSRSYGKIDSKKIKAELEKLREGTLKK